MKLISTLLMFALAGYATRLYLDHRTDRGAPDADDASGPLDVTTR